MKTGRAGMRFALIVLYGTIGVVHLAASDRFLAIMPEWVPQPRGVVIATGLCELAGVVGLLLPRWRRLTGIMLALYAVCVFPANIRHAFEGISVPGLPDSWWYHAPRLGFQPVLVWWALYATHVVDWPFGRSDDPASRSS